LYRPITPFRVSSLEIKRLTSPAQLPAPATVLVVEDEASVRHLCARILEAEGYRVLTAGDGLEALAVLEASGSEIKLVISDLKMPRLDGLQLSACLAARRVAPPMIFMSGYNLDRPGDRPVLPKPFHPSDLLAAVERILQTGPRAVAH
jgi:two-component system, chemotaxis family, chemotaxis protein CheY